MHRRRCRSPSPPGRETECLSIPTGGLRVKRSARGWFLLGKKKKRFFPSTLFRGRLHTRTRQEWNGHSLQSPSTGGNPSRGIDDEGSTGREGNRPPPPLPPRRRSNERGHTPRSGRRTDDAAKRIRSEDGDRPKKINAADPSSKRRRHGIRARDALLPAAPARRPVETLARTRATYPHETGTRDANERAAGRCRCCEGFFFFRHETGVKTTFELVRTAGELREKKTTITKQRPSTGHGTARKGHNGRALTDTTVRTGQTTAHWRRAATRGRMRRRRRRRRRARTHARSRRHKDRAQSRAAVEATQRYCARAATHRRERRFVAHARQRQHRRRRRRHRVNDSKTRTAKTNGICRRQRSAVVRARARGLGYAPYRACGTTEKSAAAAAA